MDVRLINQSRQTDLGVGGQRFVDEEHLVRCAPGGSAAVLAAELSLRGAWIMGVISIDNPPTLPAAKYLDRWETTDIAAYFGHPHSPWGTRHRRNTIGYCASTPPTGI